MTRRCDVRYKLHAVAGGRMKTGMVGRLLRSAVLTEPRPRLLWVMWIFLGLYLAGLMLHGEGFNPAVDLWLGMPASWAPAAVAWLAACRARNHVALSLEAMALSAFA